MQKKTQGDGCGGSRLKGPHGKSLETADPGQNLISPKKKKKREVEKEDWQFKG